MTMPLLPDDTTFKHRDAGSYAPVVDHFDHFVNRFSPPLVDRLLDLVQLGAATRLLDIGTGTGIVALAAARRLRPPGSVVGIDLAEPMLATARQRAAQAGLTDRLVFSAMDAEALTLADRSYEAVVSLYALLHFPNPDKALMEMYRVLQPGGRLAIGIGSSAPLLSADGIRHRLSRLPDLIATRQGRLLIAPAYLDNLVERLVPEAPAPEETALARAGLNRSASAPELVRRAGFVNLQVHWQGHRAVIDDPEEFWTLQRTFSSIARKRLESANKELMAAVKAEFMTTCQAVLERGGQLIYPYAALFIVAERPG